MKHQLQKLVEASNKRNKLRNKPPGEPAHSTNERDKEQRVESETGVRPRDSETVSLTCPAVLFTSDVGSEVNLRLRCFRLVPLSANRQSTASVPAPLADWEITLPRNSAISSWNICKIMIHKWTEALITPTVETHVHHTHKIWLSQHLLWKNLYNNFEFNWTRN